MLIGLDRVQHQRLTLVQFGQLVFERLVLVVLLVLGLFVDLEETVKLQHRAADPEIVAAISFGFDIDSRLVIDRLHHLRGDKALPDQAIELVLLFGEKAVDLVRMQRDVGRADRLVSVLRIFLRFVSVRLRGQIVLADLLLDVSANVVQRLRSDPGRIGTHVGDQADRAFGADLQAFIQPLRHAHGALDVETQLTRGVLLQLAGGKRRGGRLAALLLLNRADLPLCFFELSDDCLGGYAIRQSGRADGRHLRLFAVDADKPGGEIQPLRRGMKRGVDGPVFDRIESLDLLLALDD